MKSYGVEVQFTLHVEAENTDHAEEIVLEKLSDIVNPEEVAITWSWREKDDLY